MVCPAEPPSERLRHRADFLRTYRAGRRYRSGELELVVAPNGRTWTRVGVAVEPSGKGRSVVRNRLRRLVRAVYRAHRTQVRVGYDLLLVVRGRALTFRQVEASWQQLGRRAGVL